MKAWKKLTAARISPSLFSSYEKSENVYERILLFLPSSVWRTAEIMTSASETVAKNDWNTFTGACGCYGKFLKMNAPVLEFEDFVRLCVGLNSLIVSLSSRSFLGTHFSLSRTVPTDLVTITIHILVMKGAPTPRHTLMLFAARIRLFLIRLGHIWTDFFGTGGLWAGPDWFTVF